jgi:hypothetical protein
MGPILTLVSGLAWTIVYAESIRAGFRGLVLWFRKYPDGLMSDQMPMTASARATN